MLNDQSYSVGLAFGLSRNLDRVAFEEDELVSAITGFLFDPNNASYEEYDEDSREILYKACLQAIRKRWGEALNSSRTFARLTSDVMNILRDKDMDAPRGWLPVLNELRERGEHETGVEWQEFIEGFLEKVNEVCAYFIDWNCKPPRILPDLDETAEVCLTLQQAASLLRIFEAIGSGKE